MKKRFFLVSLLFFCFLANAQYKINKIKFDYRTYEYQQGDKYNPELAGITSLLVPGFGQCISGEPGRGLAFFGSSMVCLITLFSAIPDLAPSPGASARRAVFGGIGILTLWFWSIGDAQRVAKVNCLAWRDRNKSSLKMELQPFFGTLSYAGSEKSTPGISFKITF